MKSYEEMAKSVFRRMEEYETAKKQRRKKLNRVILPLCGIFCMLVIGLGVWKGGWLQTSSTSADEGIPTFDVPEGVNLHEGTASWGVFYRSIGEMTEAADFIGLVQISGVDRSGSDGVLPYTYFEAEILDCVYSRAKVSESLLLYMTGKRTDTDLWQDKEDPLMNVGEKWFVFAKRISGSGYVVIGGPSGRFAYGGENQDFTWLPNITMAELVTSEELDEGLTLEELKAGVQNARESSAGIPVLEIPEGMELHPLELDQEEWRSMASLKSRSVLSGMVEFTEVLGTEEIDGIPYTLFKVVPLLDFTGGWGGVGLGFTLRMPGKQTDTELWQDEKDPLPHVGEKWFVFIEEGKNDIYTIRGGPTGRFAYQGGGKPFIWLPKLTGYIPDENSDLLTDRTLNEMMKSIRGG